VSDDYLVWIKICLLTVAMAIINLGASIEPDKAIWAMAFGGSLGGVAIGIDRAAVTMIVHWFLGMMVGVTAAPYINSSIGFPKPMSALVAAILGTKIILTVWKRIDTEGVSWLVPWSKKP